MQIEVLRSIRIEADLRDQLEQLPPKLEQLYEQLYLTLAAKPGVRGQWIIDNVFKWLLCARQDFNSADFIIAVTMNLPIPPSAVTKEKILHLCRNFVVFDEGSDVFRFAHLSVQEFLEKRPGFLQPTNHALAAEACLMSVLLHTGCDGAQQFLTRDCNLNTEGKLESPRNTKWHSFHNYATQNWHRHFREVEETDAMTGSLEKISRFFLFPNPVYKSPLEIWLNNSSQSGEYGYGCVRLADMIDRQSKPIAVSIIVACALGLGGTVRSCLNNEDINEEIKNQCVEIAIDRLEEGTGNILKLLLTEDSNLLFPHEWLNEVVRSCASGWTSTNHLTFFLDLLAERTSMEDLLANAVVSRRAFRGSVKVVEILLDRAGDFLITQNLLDKAIHNRWADFDLVDLLLSRPGSARVTEGTLLAALTPKPRRASLSTVIAKLLDHAGTNGMTPPVLASSVWRTHDTSIVQQIPDRPIVTENVVDAAARSGDCQLMTLILEHGGARHVSSGTIIAAVEGGNVELVTMLLGRGGDVTQDAVQKAASGRSAEVLMLLLDRGGMVTQDAVQIAVSSQSAEALMLLLDRGGDVTQDAVQNAASGWSAEVLMLLLDRGGMVTQPIFEAAASTCSLEVFTLLLEKGGTLTDTLLEATLRNRWSGAKIMEVLLDQDPPFVTAKDIPQLFERTMVSVCNRIHLAERLLALMPDQEISATILTSVIRDGFVNWKADLLKLFFRGPRRLHITESVLVTALEHGPTLGGTVSFIGLDICITLFERAGNIAFSNPNLILEAAAAHYHADELLQNLLRRWHDVTITEAVFEAAAGNLLCGKEALLLLEAHSGRIINTQAVAKAAICRGSLPATRLLLARPRDWSVTEELVMCATWNKEVGTEMVKLLVNKLPGTITDSLIIEAARDKRCQDTALKALLGFTKINKIPEDLLLTIFKHHNPCIVRRRTAKIEVLLQACSFVEITESVFEAITKMAFDPSSDHTPSKLLQLFLERCKLPPLNERMLKVAINSEDAVALFEVLIVNHKQEIRIRKEDVECAARYGKVELLRFFAACGLWTQPIDEWIGTANRMENMIRQLERAAERGDQAGVWDLVLAGVAVDQPDTLFKWTLVTFKWTPLMGAARAGHESVVSILLAFGAQPDRADSHGSTALHLAAEFGHWKVVETLLNSGKVSMDADGDGDTPLSMAVEGGHLGVVRLLEDYIERQRKNSEQKAREP